MDTAWKHREAELLLSSQANSMPGQVTMRFVPTRDGRATLPLLGFEEFVDESHEVSAPSLFKSGWDGWP